MIGFWYGLWRNLEIWKRGPIFFSGSDGEEQGVDTLRKIWGLGGGVVRKKFSTQLNTNFTFSSFSQIQTGNKQIMFFFSSCFSHHFLQCYTESHRELLCWLCFRQRSWRCWKWLRGRHTGGGLLDNAQGCYRNGGGNREDDHEAQNRQLTRAKDQHALEDPQAVMVNGFWTV